MGSRTEWTRVVCISLMVFGMTTPASAQETSSRINGPLRKLGRGIANVATCPIELLRTTETVTTREGFLAGATVGVLQGVWRTVLRGVVGVFEVATFFQEIPPGYRPLIQPEFAFGESW